MIINTTNDGEDFTITIEDGNKNFSFEISVVAQLDGKTWIEYTNSADEVYELLNVTAEGEITNEVPKIN